MCPLSSSNGPLTRPRYASTCLGVQEHHTNRIDTRVDHNVGILYVKTELLPPRQNGIDISGYSIGSRIRQERIAKSMKITDLAQACNLCEVTIIDIEHNRVEPSLITLKILGQVLGVPFPQLAAFDALSENTFAERIKKARLMLGMNKTQFAKFIGVDISTIRFWERGNQTPQKNNLENLNLKILNLGFEL